MVNDQMYIDLLIPPRVSIEKNVVIECQANQEQETSSKNQGQNAQVQRNGERPNVHPAPPRVRKNRVQANQEQEPVCSLQGVNQQFVVL